MSRKVILAMRKSEPMGGKSISLTANRNFRLDFLAFVGGMSTNEILNLTSCKAVHITRELEKQFRAKSK